ncbi:hypothetical protein EVAR_62872_1 [Eumeta japonica]|uniref:Uncharacterized protein n=1 Tax=Eumeta variegata TaxID=151549 RepID=A0A4C1Z082_EUMVA|nr:hypothetical protein EVAR_62872_1 [Eumeta japonica]
MENDFTLRIRQSNQGSEVDSGEWCGAKAKFKPGSSPRSYDIIIGYGFISIIQKRSVGRPYGCFQTNRHRQVHTDETHRIHKVQTNTRTIGLLMFTVAHDTHNLRGVTYAM